MPKKSDLQKDIDAIIDTPELEWIPNAVVDLIEEHTRVVKFSDLAAPRDYDGPSILARICRSYPLMERNGGYLKRWIVTDAFDFTNELKLMVFMFKRKDMCFTCLEFQGFFLLRNFLTSKPENPIKDDAFLPVEVWGDVESVVVFFGKEKVPLPPPPFDPKLFEPSVNVLLYLQHENKDCPFQLPKAKRPKNRIKKSDMDSQAPPQKTKNKKQQQQSGKKKKSKGDIACLPKKIPYTPLQELRETSPKEFCNVYGIVLTCEFDETRAKRNIILNLELTDESDCEFPITIHTGKKDIFHEFRGDCVVVRLHDVQVIRHGRRLSGICYNGQSIIIFRKESNDIVPVSFTKTHKSSTEERMRVTDLFEYADARRYLKVITDRMAYDIDAHQAAINAQGGGRCLLCEDCTMLQFHDELENFIENGDSSDWDTEEEESDFEEASCHPNSLSWMSAFPAVSLQNPTYIDSGAYNIGGNMDSVSWLTSFANDTPSKASESSDGDPSFRPMVKAKRRYKLKVDTPNLDLLPDPTQVDIASQSPDNDSATWNTPQNPNQEKVVKDSSDLGRVLSPNSVPWMTIKVDEPPKRSTHKACAKEFADAGGSVNPNSVPWMTGLVDEASQDPTTAVLPKFFPESGDALDINSLTWLADYANELTPNSTTKEDPRKLLDVDFCRQMENLNLKPKGDSSDIDFCKQMESLNLMPKAAKATSDVRNPAAELSAFRFNLPRYEARSEAIKKSLDTLDSDRDRHFEIRGAEAEIASIYENYFPTRFGDQNASELHETDFDYRDIFSCAPPTQVRSFRASAENNQSIPKDGTLPENFGKSSSNFCTNVGKNEETLTSRKLSFFAKVQQKQDTDF